MKNRHLASNEATLKSLKISDSIKRKTYCIGIIVRLFYNNFRKIKLPQVYFRFWVRIIGLIIFAMLWKAQGRLVSIFFDRTCSTIYFCRAFCRILNLSWISRSINQMKYVLGKSNWDRTKLYRRPFMTSKWILYLIHSKTLNFHDKIHIVTRYRN